MPNLWSRAHYALGRAGQPHHVDRAFTLHGDWRSWVLGFQWHRDPEESGFNIHLGPLSFFGWWERP